MEDDLASLSHWSERYGKKEQILLNDINCSTKRKMLVIPPVGYIYVYDAGFQKFPIQVSARCQEPALVVGQTVANKQHIVFLRRLAKCLPKFRLLVFYWC